MERIEGSWVYWGTVASGVLVAALCDMLFVALGAGIGGYTASRVLLHGGDGSALATGAGVWTAGSAVIALFLGSYFAVRFSSITHRQVAACQSLVISAVFFVVALSSFGASTVGSLSGLAAAITTSDLTISDAAASARAVGSAGTLLFVTILLSVPAAVFGAIEGTIGNLRRPLVRSTRASSETTHQKAA